MKRVHLIEQSRFARDLAGLLRIGYPAVEAVEKLEKSRDDSLRPVLERAVGKMHAGSSFSESIKDESALLPPDIDCGGIGKASRGDGESGSGFGRHCRSKDAMLLGHSLS